MKIYRHRNGNGSVVGEGAHVSADTFLNRESTVEGESSIHASAVSASALRDVFAYESTLQHSAIADSRLARAHVVRSHVQGSAVVDGAIIASNLRGVTVEPAYGFSPHVKGVTLEDVIVSGGVALEGEWEMRGRYRIDRGLWERAPRHMEIEGSNGVHVGVSECTPGLAHVACRCKSIEFWLGRGVSIAARLGWTKEQIEECRNFLKSL